MTPEPTLVSETEPTYAVIVSNGHGDEAVTLFRSWTEANAASQDAVDYLRDTDCVVRISPWPIEAQRSTGYGECGYL